MLARAETDEALSRGGFEKRMAARATIALPILIDFDGSRRSALLRNLSIDGAMIETSAPLSISTRIKLHCGTLEMDGIVLWRSGASFGGKIQTAGFKAAFGRSAVAVSCNIASTGARRLRPPG